MNPTLAQQKYALGRVNQLQILRLVSIGAYLEWSNEEGILLPKSYLPQTAQVGDVIRAFVYHDNDARPIATTLQPLIQVGQVAYLRCEQVTRSGAFLSWGIHRNLFVPFAEQAEEMTEGRSYLVYAYVDHISGKIVGTSKLGKWLGTTLPDYAPGHEVSVQVWRRTDIGYRVVVEHKHLGMLYHSDTPQSLRQGQQLRAYVVRVREDGKLDLSLQAVGYKRVSDEVDALLRLIASHRGRLPVGDKSDAEDILRVTGLSKRVFKQTIGALYKQGLVRPYPTYVELVKSEG